MASEPAKIDPALKSKWVEALRSGDFKQGTGQFESDGKFCCLGVLCIVAGEPTTSDGIGNWRFADNTLGDNGDGSSWSGKLASMNDQGHSFQHIAHFIEREL
jgi:hypothetical protein